MPITYDPRSKSAQYAQERREIANARRRVDTEPVGEHTERLREEAAQQSQGTASAGVVAK